MVLQVGLLASISALLFAIIQVLLDHQCIFYSDLEDRIVIYIYHNLLTVRVNK